MIFPPARSTLWIKVLTSVVLCTAAYGSTCWDDNKPNHKIKILKSRKLYKQLDCCDLTQQFKNLMAPILVTRVPGSSGSAAVRQYISSTLGGLGWTVELQNFTQNTVIGTQTFVNIIATQNINSPRRLVLAAHYDSKMSPEGFIGATDSAAPCTMLLDLAIRLNSLLKKQKMGKRTPELSVQLIFFDGEEAFIQWTDTDSLYGSRYMAQQLASTPYTVDPALGFCQNNSATQLDRIDSFVLLDLIGASKPKFLKFSDYDVSLWESMQYIEKKIVLLNGQYTGIPKVMRGKKGVPGFIEDDHLPFLSAGVKNILHLIASPFPAVWHTMEDSENNLDVPTILYIQQILRIFVIQYLHLV